MSFNTRSTVEDDAVRVLPIYNTFKQLSMHNTEDLCFCAMRAMLSAVVFTNGRQMAYAVGYYTEWVELPL